MCVAGHARLCSLCTLLPAPCCQHRPEGLGSYLVNILAGQHTQGPFVHIHDGCVWAPPRLHVLIRVQPDQQEVTRLLGKLVDGRPGGWIGGWVSDVCEWGRGLGMWGRFLKKG